jgi:hypothetical protein
MRQDDPYLDAGVRGWIVTTARKNYWKVASWYEITDLIQDGYLCYAKCRARFIPQEDTPEPTHDDRKRFMAFFQMAYINQITDLANSRTKTPETAMAGLSEKQADAVEAWASSASELGGGSLSLLLTQAPAEIMEMLKLILVDGVANGPYLKSRLRKKLLPNGANPRMVKGRRALRETTEEHYDRCLGRTGVVAQLRAYLLGQEPDLLDKLVSCLFTGEEQNSSRMS